jgi:hypothetical protein
MPNAELMLTIVYGRQLTGMATTIAGIAAAMGVGHDEAMRRVVPLLESRLLECSGLSTRRPGLLRITEDGLVRLRRPPRPCLVAAESA